MRATLRVLAVFGAFAVACVALRHVDIATMGGGFKGDEATYVGLAASAGLDGDLTYGPRDYQRFREWYGGGPQGIFLRRGDDGQLYFGKAFLYGVLAAPFALAGGLGGLLVFNFACFALLLSAGYLWLRPGSRRCGRARIHARFPGCVDCALVRVLAHLGCAELRAGVHGIRRRRRASWRAASTSAIAGARLRPARRGDLLQALESPSCLAARDGRTRRWSGADSASACRHWCCRRRLFRDQRRDHGGVELPGRRPQDLLRHVPVRRGWCNIRQCRRQAGNGLAGTSWRRRSRRIACGQRLVFRAGPPFWSASVWVALARRGRLVGCCRTPKDVVAMGNPGRDRHGSAWNDRVDALHMVGWRRTRRESVLPERRGRAIFSGAAGAVVRSNCSRRPGSAVCVAIALQPIYGRQAAVACHARGHLRARCRSS